MFVLTSILSLLLFGAANASGFDYNLNYPPIRSQSRIFITRTPFVEAYETPIRIRFTSILTSTVWNCLATYHPSALNALTRERPIVVPPQDIIQMHGNSNTRFLCAAYALLIVDSVILPEYGGSDIHIDLMNELGLEFDESTHLEINDEVEACGIHNKECLEAVAAKHGYIPEIMGSIVALQSVDYLEQDGWNAHGEDAGCTANCRAYSDTTGYKPDFYNPHKWVPLVEDNGKGFFYHYDHVTPHIGFTATTRVLTRPELEARRAPKPMYGNYKEDKQLVLDRLADLAMNDTKKMLVEFFDDKLRVAETMIFTLDELTDWTYEERQLYVVGANAAEYDAVVLAWKEKVNYDLIRPTSLIKRDGRKRITTWGGPHQGLKEIRSRDFESYHRVMPHSEYPSGSGCICMARAQYVDKLMKERYGIDNVPYDIPMFKAGESIVEPGTTPANDIPAVRLPNLTEMYELCGETRLWGGMHFTRAVSGSYELCDGVGELAYEWVNGLLDGKPLNYD